MVTLDKVGGSQVTKSAQFFGKSTDTKPTEGVPNGSVFVEMDTGDGYFFDAETSTWLAV